MSDEPVKPRPKYRQVQLAVPYPLWERVVAVREAVYGRNPSLAESDIMLSFILAGVETYERDKRRRDRPLVVTPDEVRGVRRAL